MLHPRFAILCLTVVACSQAAAPDRATDAADATTPDVLRPPRVAPDRTPYAHPLVGTQGQGNTIPGACVPHGMVKVSPDTENGGGSIVGYEYTSTKIQGFAHTELEGPGGSAYGYGHVLVTPVVGNLVPGLDKNAVGFLHDGEVAAPGYYKVKLANGVTTELTATAHGGLHRYTFTQSDSSHIVIDIGHTRGDSRDGHLAILGTDGLRGYGDYSVWPMLTGLLEGWADGSTGLTRIWFAAQFSKHFKASGTWHGSVSGTETSADGANSGAWFDFDTAAGEAIEVRVALSYISAEQADKNLEKELLNRSFDVVRQAAATNWNDLLARVEVEGGSDIDKNRFYTAVYHTFLQPSDYTEDGQFWDGGNGTGKVRNTGGRRYFADDWCMWDTAKTTHPLLTLLEPDAAQDMVQSMVWHYETAGWISKCSWNATGDSRVMTANSPFCVVADAWAKGLRNFDEKTAWQAIWKGATQDAVTPLDAGACGYLDLGTPAHYVEHGWVPKECDNGQAASMTLEYAYNDWCAAQVADGVKETAARDTLLTRAKNFKNVWNPAHGFMQLRKANGDWVEPFDPTAISGFTEANSWIYSWYAPHDVCGLMTLMGGKDAFLSKLDTFFGEKHFDVTNEPDFHVPWMYIDAGQPQKAQELVRKLMMDHFKDEPEGLPGNDDSGATSAWFVFAALGLYPMAPGDPWYRISSPLFERATLFLEPKFADGKTFVIEAQGNSAANVYIQSATLNGKPLNEARIRHQDIVTGGKLVLVMGAQPSQWASEGLCNKP